MQHHQPGATHAHHPNHVHSQHQSLALSHGAQQHASNPASVVQRNATLAAGGLNSNNYANSVVFAQQSDDLAKTIEKLTEQMTHFNLERLKKLK